MSAQDKLPPQSPMIYCATCGMPQHEFSDKEIDAMRSHLAKSWGQSVSQVTEYEAVHSLRQEAS